MTGNCRRQLNQRRQPLRPSTIPGQATSPLWMALVLWLENGHISLPCATTDVHMLRVFASGVICCPPRPVVLDLLQVVSRTQNASAALVHVTAHNSSVHPQQLDTCSAAISPPHGGPFQNIRNL